MVRIRRKGRHIIQAATTTTIATIHLTTTIHPNAIAELTTVIGHVWCSIQIVLGSIQIVLGSIQIVLGIIQIVLGIVHTRIRFFHPCTRPLQACV
jgi:hypothetical protein